MSWYVIEGEQLLAALKRAHDGDDPSIVLLEIEANSERDEP